MTSPGNTTLAFEIPVKLKDRLKELAKADRRTLSNYIVTNLERLADQEENKKD